MNRLKSYIFLLLLFYLRYIPLAVFWHLFMPIIPTKRSFSKVLVLISITLSYIFSLFILAAPLLFFLNFFLMDDSRREMLLSLFLFLGGVENSFPPSSHRESLFSRVNVKRSKLSMLAANVVSLFSVAVITLGSIEVFNDFNSHSSPDIFDLFFPDFGGSMFWGGITLLTLSSFYTYFLSNTQSVRKWKYRWAVASSFPDFLKDLIFSFSLTHPYFFLEQKSRGKHINSPKLRLLLKRAFREDKDHIPSDWMK